MHYINWKIPGLMFLFTGIAGCGKPAVKSTKTNAFPDLQVYFQRQIKLLDSLHPKVHKTMVVNDEPVDQEMDSTDWKDELAIFEMLDLGGGEKEPKFSQSVDSNGALKITHYTALDTNREVQHISITEKNGNIELVEAFLKKRTFVVDWDTRLSYQPGRGYGIQIKENYIWSKPKSKEIFAEMDAEGFLRK